MAGHAKSDVRPSRWAGRVLCGKWRIDGRLSRGGVGTVYAATHQNNGSRVAIKVLNPEFSRDADVRGRFLQEGYAANQVGHPGVVKILDDDTTEEGFAFLVMELLEGELLEDRRVRSGGMLPIEEVYEVADQLLEVLEAAHDKGIVHRDIKPDNLFLTTEGRLKVLDFGFAQMKRGLRKENTVTGFLLGTPGFMPPEQSIGDRTRIDARTDIWAVGATLFNLVSGRPVHEGESAAAMLVAAANKQPRSLDSVVSGLPMMFVQIVDRAVAFDPADRWPNARSMRAALRKVARRTSAGHAGSRRSSPEFQPIDDDEDDLEDAATLAGTPLPEDAPTVAAANFELPRPLDAYDSVATTLMPMRPPTPHAPFAHMGQPEANFALGQRLAAPPVAPPDDDVLAVERAARQRRQAVLITALVACGLVVLALFALNAAN